MATEIARLFMAVDSSQVRGATRDLQGMAGAASGLGKMLGGLAIGGTLAAMAKHVFNATAEFQKLQSQLVTVTGSAALAGQAFKEIEQFATETPFQLGEVVQAFTKMKAMGLDPSMESLRAWGDLASANGKNILDTVQAVANATMGEAEMLKQYGIKMMQAGNRVTFTYNGVTSTVARNSKAIEAHLMNLAKTNFGGGMQREMATIGGAMSNLQDQVDKTSRAIGDAFAGQGMAGIKGFTSAIDQLTPSLQGLASATGEIASSFGQVTEATNGMIQPVKIVGGALEYWAFYLRMVKGAAVTTLDLFQNIGTAVTNVNRLMMGQKMLDLPGFRRSSYEARLARSATLGFGRGLLTDDEEPEVQKTAYAMLAQGKGGGTTKDLAGDTDAATKATRGFIDALRDQVATLGLSETQMLRYKAAQLGLSGNKEVQALIARKEAWDLEEQAVEGTVKALEDYAAKAKLLGGGDTEKVLAEMAAFGPEASKGLMEYTRTLDEITDQYADLREATLYWQNDFTNAMVEMTFTGKNLWRDMVDSMLRDLARLAVQKNVTSPLFDWLGAGLLELMGGGTPTATAGATYSVEFLPDSVGGMANPSGMGGTMPMKAAPTGMGGTMPMKAGPTSTAPIIVNINQETGATSTQGSGDMARLGQAIGAKVREVLRDEQRPGGILAREGAR